MSELGEVTIVRYGTRTGRRDEVYLNHHIYGEADGRIEMDYFFWIVRTSTETILVDTGFSATGGRSGWNAVQARDRAVQCDALGDANRSEIKCYLLN